MEAASIGMISSSFLFSRETKAVPAQKGDYQISVDQ
jgi:hypothetical protein